MELISNLALAKKNSGDTLYAKEINSLRDTVENLVSIVNNMLKRCCDVNLEDGNITGTYKLADAVNFVPENRRTPGFLLRFRAEDNKYYEYVYNSEDTEDENWGNLDNWNLSVVLVDGGEI